MSFVSDIFDAFTGKTGAEAVEQSAAIQAQAGREAITAGEEAAGRAQEFFEPFAGVAQRGIDLSGFLGDPAQQFEFLQGNPLFDLALENANRQTLQRGAAGGRLSAGDTLQRLSENVLLSAQPLVTQQRQDIRDLLNLGTGVATTRGNIEIGQGTNVANLLTDIGSARAAGTVGAAQARSQGAQNLLGLGLTAAGFPGAAGIGGFAPPPPALPNLRNIGSTGLIGGGT